MRALLVFVAMLSAAAPAAAAEPGSVQPGDWVSLGGGCTLGWAFDGSDGATYFGTVGHCTRVGEEAFVADPAAPSGPAGPTPGDSLGFVVARGADQSIVAQDVALVRVREPMARRVAGAMRGHPDMPSGVIEPPAIASRDALQLSGWGIGWDVAQQTREGRQAILLDGDPLSWEGVAPVTGGDSGGPVAHVATGRALGFVKGGACGDAAGGSCKFWGPSIAAMKQLAQTEGVALTLRLAGQAAPVAPAPPPPSPGSPPASGPPTPAAPPAPAQVTLRARARTLRARSRRVSVTLVTSRPLTGVRVFLLKGGRRVATARIPRVGGRATVVLRASRGLRSGSHRIALSARDDRGRAVTRSIRATVR